MAEKIFQAWLKHKQTRTIGFCSSIKQAVFLSDYFNRKGVKSISLHSKQVNIRRDKAIEMLENGELEAIFTVDLFNEGVDIPVVDTLLFVRPTESLTVFTQQIGRGLRLHPEKEYCVVIDLIGNYRNADVKLSVFQADDSDKKGKNNNIPSIPVSCVIDIETRVINLLDELRRKRQPRKERLRENYFDLKQELGRRPSYLELHLKGKSNSAEYKQDFKSYFGFLYWLEELNSFEADVYKRYENWFIEVEKTGMAKSYKMLVLLAMLERGKSNWNKPITAQEVAPLFHHYLMETPFRRNIDFSDNTTKKLWQYDEKKVSKLIVDMPMTKWSSSAKELVTFDGTNFSFNFDIVDEDQKLVFNWTKQICEYRLHQHFERKSKNNNS